jgi:hypothetical protein
VSCLWAAVLFVLLGAAAPAVAHTSALTTEHVSRSVDGAADSPAADPASFISTGERQAPALWWLALAAAALIVGPRRPRHAVVVTLALVLLVFTFETARHSVHHLGGDQTKHCVVASAATHLSGLGVASISLDDPVLRVDGWIPEVGPSVWPAGSLRPVTGRAPPSA